MMFRTSFATFAYHYSHALKNNPNAASSCTPMHEISSNGEFYITRDGLSGFCISAGELKYLFSEVKGRGDELVTSAKALGANHLDCFDGYLVELYKRNGFIEFKRVANWTEGEPDVVYMATPRDMSGWAGRTTAVKQALWSANV